jgi:hypothetical protein
MTETPNILGAQRLDGGSLPPENFHPGTGAEVVRAKHALVLVSAEEVAHLVEMYPNDFLDVQITNEEPLALHCHGSYASWMLRELVKTRGVDQFQYAPYVYDF